MYYNLIKLLQLGFRLVVMRYAQSSEFRMKLKRIPGSWGARPPRPSQLFLSARFTETCHTSSSSTGTKAVDAGEREAKQRRQKAIEGERRGRRMEKKRGERGGGVKENGKRGEKVGENVKKVSLNFPRI